MTIEERAMRKSVLISIRPKWVERILSGEKTIEIRKTAPKIKTPFKCYIYKTPGKRKDSFAKNTQEYFGCGKVVGEFVCDKIYKIKKLGSKFVVAAATESETNKVARESCLSFDDMEEYAGEREYIYGWHISNVKIYENPKELSAFWKPNKCPFATNDGCTYQYHCYRAGETERCGETLERPPQSWCYQEELN